MLFYIINITPPRLNPITQLLLQSRQTCTTFTSLPTRLRFNSFSLRLFQFFYILIYSSVTSCPLPRLNPVQLLLPPSVSILLPYLCSLHLRHPCRSIKAKFIYYLKGAGGVGKVLEFARGLVSADCSTILDVNYTVNGSPSLQRDMPQVHSERNHIHCIHCLVRQLNGDGFTKVLFYQRDPSNFRLK